MTMEISLENDALNVSTTLKNTGGEVVEFASALKSHIAVADVEDSTTNYVGLQDCISPGQYFTSDEASCAIH